MAHFRYYAPSHPWAYARFQGTISDAEMVRAFQQFDPRKDHQEEFRELMDCRDVEDVTGVTAAAIARVADYEAARHTRNDGRLAILVRTSLQIGMTNMFLAVARRAVHRIEIFTDLEHALEWLDPVGGKDALRDLAESSVPSEPNG